MADVGIIDKDQNASSPNLDNYDIYYYEVGAKNMTNVTDSSGIINITRIYVTTNLGSPTLVNTFVDWIRSPRGQQIVNNSGYISHLQEMNGVNP
jgi:ABC-type phosphate transport system substrate-binding protein